jgi:para-aminobenzoate synthetase
MRTLLVDNHDSYTYNVFHLLAAASGEEPVVVNNDAVSWRVLSRSDFDAIVLSPGPGRPERWHDFGVCRDILRYSEIPVLGICLGHQGIGNLLDGGVNSAPTPMHGRLSRVRHSDRGIFRGIPQDFSVVRYHSLAVTRPGPEGQEVAWAEDGVVMGIEHRSRPMWGVQFHPESVATEYGRAIVENFYALADGHPRRHSRAGARETTSPVGGARRSQASGASRSGLELRTRSIEGEPDTEAIFERLFGDADPAFWLDSADAPTWLGQNTYMGASAGAERCLLSYDVDASEIAVEHGEGGTVERGSIFDVLGRSLHEHELTLDEDLQPGLVGGYVGYLGYECKADCGSPNVHSSDLPDAMLMFANRIVAVDHTGRRTHLLALGKPDDPAVEAWLDTAEAVVADVVANPPQAPPPPEPIADHVSFRVGRGETQYLSDIARSQAELAAGESYEVCLTDQISTDASPDPFALYRQLRRGNPSPFSAYLKFGERAIVSSSPERFLSVDRDRKVQARPIKGTVSRSPDPEEDERRREWLRQDEKTQAEHLMIVDLLRNDIGRVCDVDSVRVPGLMTVEPYATVHQLVSTIEGNCFPGGSMTGAPKERTMEIIDDIEGEARGVYSGSIGYFGLDGNTDLSIVIRTIVMRPGRTTIGAGGAIVMQSDAQDEFDELLLKARAPMAAIAATVTGSEADEAWSVELEPTAEAAALK